MSPHVLCAALTLLIPEWQVRAASRRVVTVIGGHPLVGCSGVVRWRGLASCTGRVAEIVCFFEFALAVMVRGGVALKAIRKG